MNIFVTGASGWIGSAVVDELHQSGHSVIGLARSDKSAKKLEDKGVKVVRGNIDDLELLSTTAKNSDGVIHLAFKHDLAFSGDFMAAAKADRDSIDAFASALKGSNKPLIIASGVMGLTPGKLLTEEDGHASDKTLVFHAEGPKARWENAEYTLSLASRGIRSSIVRLSPTNHGDGDNGFMASIVGSAKTNGVSAYIGDGKNRWPAVHRLDSAKLFKLAVEKAPAGSTLHGVADEGVEMKDIAEVIGKQLNIPVVSLSQEDAAKHFTWLAGFIGIDSPTSNKITSETMDWHPEQLGLIEDLKLGHYF